MKRLAPAGVDSCVPDCSRNPCLEAEVETRRMEQLDQWKGLAILAVIAIHASGSALSFPSSTSNWTFGLMLRQPINFAVAMFLALAGYLAGAKRFETAADRRSFWHRRLSRLLLPYFVWSFAAILLTNPLHLASPTELAKDIALGGGIGVGYFVIVLAQFVVVTPLIASLKKDWHHLMAMGLITTISLAARYYLQIERPESLLAQFPIYALPLVAWYPFYHLGFWIRRRNPSWLSRRRVMRGLFGFFLLASMVEGWLLASRGLAEFAASQVKLSSFLMSGSLFLLAPTSIGRHGRGWSRLAWLGRNSYFIYLTHVLPLGILRSVLSKSIGLYTCQPAFVMVLFAATAASCALAVVLVLKVVPEKLATKWLGVAGPASASISASQASPLSESAE